MSSAYFIAGLYKRHRNITLITVMLQRLFLWKQVYDQASGTDWGAEGVGGNNK